MSFNYSDTYVPEPEYDPFKAELAEKYPTDNYMNWFYGFIILAALLAITQSIGFIITKGECVTWSSSGNTTATAFYYISIITIVIAALALFLAIFVLLTGKGTKDLYRAFKAGQVQEDIKHKWQIGRTRRKYKTTEDILEEPFVPSSVEMSSSERRRDSGFV